MRICEITEKLLGFTLYNVSIVLHKFSSQTDTSTLETVSSACCTKQSITVVLKYYNTMTTKGILQALLILAIDN